MIMKFHIHAWTLFQDIVVRTASMDTMVMQHGRLSMTVLPAPVSHQEWPTARAASSRIHWPSPNRQRARSARKATQAACATNAFHSTMEILIGTSPANAPVASVTITLISAVLLPGYALVVGTTQPAEIVKVVHQVISEMPRSVHASVSFGKLKSLIMRCISLISMWLQDWRFPEVHYMWSRQRTVWVPTGSWRACVRIMHRELLRLWHWRYRWDLSSLWL